MPDNSKILFFTPAFMDLIWGGNKLRSLFSYDIPTETTGEAWTISAHPIGNSIVSKGQFLGKSLTELWDEHPELFGNLKLDKFPLLIKFIDAKDDLSVQVHPDDKYANKYENGELGKKECWYIVDCEENSTIIVGNKAKNKDEFLECVKCNKWHDILNEIPIHPGDFFQIDPGTVHAIKNGTVILETQQTSDLTYRVYDYNRLQNGKPRELHLEKAIDVIKYNSYIDKPKNFSNSTSKNTELISCDKYTINLLCIKDEEHYEQMFPFLNMSVISGNGYIDDIEIKAGDCFILPYNYGKFIIKGNLKIITSHV